MVPMKDGGGVQLGFARLSYQLTGALSNPLT
jgi:hypothetical protein